MNDLYPCNSLVPKIRLPLILAMVFGLATFFILADMIPIQIENGKKATALVHIDIAGTKKPNLRRRSPGTLLPGTRYTANGTAFCIDGAGWFITCKHVTDAASDGKVSLILNASEKDQAILEAKIVRTDQEKDLALLKVAGHGPFVALQLGKVDSLMETMHLTAFGYPFGEMLASVEGDYPAITVSSGAITSLRKKEGKLELIQIDASLNPGNSGGPVLDSDGRVVGIVDAGIQNVAINVAIPVNRLREFLLEPDVEFVAPTLTWENMSKPVKFKATMRRTTGGDEDYQAELVLTVAGIKNSVLMNNVTDSFSAEVVPVPPRKGPRLHPIETPNTVEYQIAVTRENKVLKVISGEIPIDGMPVSDTNITPSAAASIISGSKTIPVKVGTQTVLLPSIVVMLPFFVH